MNTYMKPKKDEQPITLAQMRANDTAVIENTAQRIVALAETWTKFEHVPASIKVRVATGKKASRLSPPGWHFHRSVNLSKVVSRVNELAGRQFVTLEDLIVLHAERKE